MDAIKLRMRAKDQLYPMLQELITGYSRFKGSKDLEGRGKMVAWWVPLHLLLGMNPVFRTAATSYLPTAPSGIELLSG